MHLAGTGRPHALPGPTCLHHPPASTTRPSSSTTIWSHCAAVDSRWATKMEVRPWRCNAAGEWVAGALCRVCGQAQPTCRAKAKGQIQQFASKRPSPSSQRSQKASSECLRLGAARVMPRVGTGKDCRCTRKVCGLPQLRRTPLTVKPHPAFAVLSGGVRHFAPPLPWTESLRVSKKSTPSPPHAHLRQGPERLQDLRLRLGVQRAGGLVEQQDLGRLEERTAA